MKNGRSMHRGQVADDVTAPRDVGGQRRDERGYRARGDNEGREWWRPICLLRRTQSPWRTVQAKRPRRSISAAWRDVAPVLGDGPDPHERDDIGSDPACHHIRHIEQRQHQQYPDAEMPLVDSSPQDIHTRPEGMFLNAHHSEQFPSIPENATSMKLIHVSIMRNIYVAQPGELPRIMPKSDELHRAQRSTSPRCGHRTASAATGRTDLRAFRPRAGGLDGFLAVTLPSRHVALNWNVAWAGFDLGLAVVLSLVAYSALRQRAWVATAAGAAAALLIVDAWFDVTTAAPGWDKLEAIVLACTSEIPLRAGMPLDRRKRRPSLGDRPTLRSDRRPPAGANTASLMRMCPSEMRRNLRCIHRALMKKTVVFEDLGRVG